jgi:peptidoglycan hydrolase-like protein with peptidoglycan-binding domain
MPRGGFAVHMLLEQLGCKPYNRYMSTFSKTAAASLAALTLLVASGAQASGLSSTQVQAIVGLMQSFGADASTIGNVQAALNGQATSGSPATVANCIALTHTMSRGSTDATSGGDVSKLQAFFGITPTGYFGAQTQSLVQNWQAAHGVVSSGSAATTGFGVVGAKTRAAMACSGITSTTPSPTPTQSPVPAPLYNPSASVNATGAINATSQTITAGSAQVITGTAQNTPYVVLALFRGHGFAFLSKPTAVVNGTWSITLPTTLIASNYSMILYDGGGLDGGKTLARGSLTIH